MSAHTPTEFLTEAILEKTPFRLNLMGENSVMSTKWVPYEDFRQAQVDGAA